MRKLILLPVIGLTVCSCKNEPEELSYEEIRLNYIINVESIIEENGREASEEVIREAYELYPNTERLSADYSWLRVNYRYREEEEAPLRLKRQKVSALKVKYAQLEAERLRIINQIDSIKHKIPLVEAKYNAIKHKVKLANELVKLREQYEVMCRAACQRHSDNTTLENLNNIERNEEGDLLRDDYKESKRLVKIAEDRLNEDATPSYTMETPFGLKGQIDDLNSKLLDLGKQQAELARELQSVDLTETYEEKSKNDEGK